LLALVLFYNYQLKRKANDGLKERNKEIQRQAIELGNLNGTKDKLFSIISHDLRSPLSSLRGLMDLVIQGVLSKEEFLPVARNLKLSLESVQENLDNLLFWAQSQLKGLQVKPEPFLLKPLIEEKTKLFLEISRSKDIAIIHEVDEEVMVFADKNYLRLVLRNLLANAIKFSTHGGTIIIRQKELADEVEISVSDAGIGMSADDLAKLFHAETHFSNPGTLKEKGIGIGLLLTKEFIEKNEGTIRVTSELGKGSTFTFTLRRHRTHVVKEEVLSSF
jgi:signal transduction histidine kinase